MRARGDGPKSGLVLILNGVAMASVIIEVHKYDHDNSTFFLDMINDPC